MALDKGGTLKNKKYPSPFPKVQPPNPVEIEKGEPKDNENSETIKKKNRSNLIKSLIPQTGY